MWPLVLFYLFISNKYFLIILDAKWLICQNLNLFQKRYFKNSFQLNSENKCIQIVENVLRNIQKNTYCFPFGGTICGLNN